MFFFPSVKSMAVVYIRLFTSCKFWYVFIFCYFYDKVNGDLVLF